MNYSAHRCILAILAMIAMAGTTMQVRAAGNPPKASDAAARSAAMPRYDHIFVIIEENKGYQQIMDHPQWTPVIHRLAAEYGQATQFYGEVHLSEANYIAMLGGDTFGIHDDDAYYCKPAMRNVFCEASRQPGYADHDLTARSLMEQLAEKGMTWKVYMQTLPGAGSLVPRWPTPDYPAKGEPYDLYAAKHNGFVNFKDINGMPLSVRARHIVGFERLRKDLAADDLPNYAHIVPNQCNEMHGLDEGPNIPANCNGDKNPAGLIKRGDAEIGRLISEIMLSKVWRDPGNTAIVVTFDENDVASRKHGPQGCCGYDPRSAANFGGGHIVTLVITNHGPRHVVDSTPYNHYSLLRTTEDAFGIREYLRHAGDTSVGVVSMTPLFEVKP